MTKPTPKTSKNTIQYHKKGSKHISPGHTIKGTTKQCHPLVGIRGGHRKTSSSAGGESTKKSQFYSSAPAGPFSAQRAAFDGPAPRDDVDASLGAPRLIPWLPPRRLGFSIFQPSFSMNRGPPLCGKGGLRFPWGPRGPCRGDLCSSRSRSIFANIEAVLANARPYQFSPA